MFDKIVAEFSQAINSIRDELEATNNPDKQFIRDEFVRRLREFAAQKKLEYAGDEECDYFFELIEKNTLSRLDKKTITRVYIYNPEDFNVWQTKEYDLPEFPILNDLTPIFEEHFGDAWVEHVNVLFDEGNKLHAQDGVPADMFVDENGIAKDLLVNNLASHIYWANSVRNYGREAVANAIRNQQIGAIHGKAIVFNRKVWY